MTGDAIQDAALATIAVLLALVWLAVLLAVSGPPLRRRAVQARRAALGAARWDPRSAGGWPLRLREVALRVSPEPLENPRRVLFLLMGGVGPACLLPALPGTGLGAALATCPLTVVPLLSVRRLRASTHGTDSVLDQALSDARRAPATRWLPDGRRLLPLAFLCAGASLFVFALASAPSAPALAAFHTITQRPKERIAREGLSCYAACGR